MNDPGSLAPVAPSSRVTFSDRRSDFRRLVMRGALLELVTVGFYRFWLATDMRRHLWSHTLIEGDAPEYTGTAKELLIGFLFALAILVPIYLVYFLIGLEAERWKAFASFPLFVFFYLFAQFAIYRARRYRLTRTVWRGVRFWMGGSGLSYAWRVGLWSLLTALSLGLALPWRQAALERFKMRHTSYGSLSGRFDGTGWDFFKRGWGVWLASVIILSLPFVLAAAKLRVLIIVAVVIQLGALPFIYAIYKAIEWRWWASGIRFGEVHFESDMSRGEMIDLYWKVIGWIGLLIVGLLIWIASAVGIAFTVTDFAGPASQKAVVASQQLWVMLAIGLGYVVAMLASWAIMRIYLTRDVWERVANSVTVHNLAAADNIVAQGDLVGALGEGFADSLDVVGF
jgi:uncharacterized membrane protein YjgN (DUF898 family)